MQIAKYIVWKWVTLLVSLIFIIGIWLKVPSVLISVFNWNTVWVAALWGWLEPHLPSEATIPIDAVQNVYAAMVMLIQNVTKLLPDLTAQQVEVATRGFLGEGWIVVVEIAIILRIAWLILRWSRKLGHKQKPPQPS